jgi:hypothetical protein
VSRVIFQASLKDGRRGKSTDGNREGDRDSGRMPDTTGKMVGAAGMDTIKAMGILPGKRLRVPLRGDHAAFLWKSF